jgi:hypothetical protein
VLAMTRFAITALIGLWAIAPMVGQTAARQMSDAQVRRAIVSDSIDSYPGPCACPYNVMRNRRACGRRSAYSRPGGYSPVCYPRDVTEAMVKDYRRTHGK